MSQKWKDIGRNSNSNTYRNLNTFTVGKNSIGKLKFWSKIKLVQYVRLNLPHYA